MLVSLRVRDLAVLEDVDVPFGPGLTVLTGETGAGKSLVVDALSLLSGERADAALVRTGAERAVVEGAFVSDDPAVREALASAGLDADPGEERPGGAGGDAIETEVVVRREVAAGGKGRLFVNGSPAAVRTLADLAPRLLVLYGQAEARELLDPSAPRELLDRWGGLAAPGARVEEAFHAWREREEERERLHGLGADASRRLELAAFQLGEIDAVAPLRGEEESLAREKGALSGVERTGRLLSDAVAALESEESGALSALSALKKSLATLSEIVTEDPQRAAESAEAAALYERASDLSASLNRALARLEADPGRLEAVVSRLDALAKLKRKYGPTLDDVLEHRERLERERDELSDLEGARHKAEEASRVALAAYSAEARALSASRSKAAPALSRAVEGHLRDLAFLRASFRVEVGRRSDPASPLVLDGAAEGVAFGPHGFDVVSLAFEPNPGEGARPLSKIASGGELSRVQLAVAAALAEEEAVRDEKGRGRGRGHASRVGGPVRTFVFDEVDAGVSGAVADAVARKLLRLSSREQVLVVTHLPQVAAAGTRHFLVSKEAAKGRTRTSVSLLDDAGRVESIAAMLAGASVGEAARRHAKELVESFRAPSGPARPGRG